MTFNLGKKTPVEKLDGVGKTRKEQLNRLGIFTAEDLLYHFPRGYENRGFVKNIVDVQDKEVCSIEVTVSSYPTSVNLKNRLNLTKFKCVDNTGTCEVTFFNQEFVKNIFAIGQNLRIYGKFERKPRRILVSNPTYEFLTYNKPLKALYPVYPLTKGISNITMKKFIDEAFKVCFNPNSEYCLRDIVPFEIKQRYNLCDTYYALYTIHPPSNPDDVIRAKDKISFDEVLRFSLSMLVTGSKKKTKTNLNISVPNRIKFLRGLSYKLTNAQTRTLNEIEKDMISEYRMQRLLTGDVGSGKTVCAMFALYTSVESGYQGAIMAPTEILSRQHYESIMPYFEKIGYKCALLTSSTKTKERKIILSGLEDGSIDIVIGTHSVLNDDVKFKSLGIVIVDEQHRFGVNQRAKLTSKSENCHVLSMTATPIPRTLALVMYGDMDISTLDELPPGRKIVSTFSLDDSYRPRMYGFLKKTINEGNQVFIVCPAIENKSNSIDEEYEKNIVPFGYYEPTINQKRSAIEYANELQNDIFPELKVGCIHGKLKNDEKTRIMEDFQNNKINILVSTTVIEVGVNIPNATVMIIENAEYFGLSQLHQLRGRVGRGSDKSYCFLMSNVSSGSAKDRLDILCKTNNGYEIAKFDLETRGPGDIVSMDDSKIKQSGDTKAINAIKIANSQILHRGRLAAQEIFDSDPDLSNHLELKKVIEEIELQKAID